MSASVEKVNSQLLYGIETVHVTCCCYPLDSVFQAVELSGTGPVDGGCRVGNRKCKTKEMLVMNYACTVTESVCVTERYSCMCASHLC